MNLTSDQQSQSEFILGIWDGHDAGAALIKGHQILAAINEERLTRRKLEVGFPSQSIRAVLKSAGLRTQDIKTVAFTTTDPSKTLTRFLPFLKENYYQFRRRKLPPSLLAPLKKKAKFKLTELRPNFLSRALSQYWIQKELKRQGIRAKLVSVDHHEAHAVAAAFCSGFDQALVVSLDGIGDGLAGSFWIFNQNKLRLFASIEGSSSLGIFFEQVTHLCNMRELEDEGKVMALANYASPIEDTANPLLDFFEVHNLELRAKYRVSRMYRELKRAAWKYPVEQFAFMAQRTLEVKTLELIRNGLKASGQRKVAYTGGIASNIKVNGQIRALPEVDDLYIFPHMGDGGQALGAAMAANFRHNRITQYSLSHLYLGSEFNEADALTAIRQGDLRFERTENPPELAGRLISNGEIIMWSQGRMEYGPRALGARSILAQPGSIVIRDALNLKLKKRVWYQPFCPSMLESDARMVLEEYPAISPSCSAFMTCAFKVKEKARSQLTAVIAVDGTCRPQILKDDDPSPLGQVLREVRKRTGLGVVLNTSFNVHGEPLVCSPDDCIRALKASGITHLILGPFWVRNGPCKH